MNLVRDDVWLYYARFVFAKNVKYCFNYPNRISQVFLSSPDTLGPIVSKDTTVLHIANTLLDSGSDAGECTITSSSGSISIHTEVVDLTSGAGLLADSGPCGACRGGNGGVDVRGSIRASQPTTRPSFQQLVTACLQ